MTTVLNLDLLRRLRDPEGKELFAALDKLQAEQQITTQNTIAVIKQLRAQRYDPELIAAGLTQARLRSRAVPKFGPQAHHMWFTQDGLEQATRSIVAKHHANRFANGLNPSNNRLNIVDLGCGIGADLIAFAQTGLYATGVELDPLTAAVASANIEALGLSQYAQVRCADATTVDVSKFDAAFCDPARRHAGKRIFHTDAYQPPWSFVLSLSQQLPTGIKVAPGIDHNQIPPAWEAEWISVSGEVVEAGLWTSEFKSTPAAQKHYALRLPEQVGLAGNGQRQAQVGSLKGWLYDPDGAVVRAHLVAELADRLNATTLDSRIAYLSSEQPHITPLARTYEVITAMPFSVKRLRTWLQNHNIGSVEIKKRGFAMTPEQLRPLLKLNGAQNCTVVLTRVANRPLAIVCQPVRALKS